MGQLTDKLREERIQRVIEPILAGDVLDAVPPDDRDYAIDLGLVQRTQGGTLAIANPIYGEVIPRVLAGSAQDSLPACRRLPNAPPPTMPLHRRVEP